VARVALRVLCAELMQFQEAIRAQRRDMMSRKKIREKKIKKKKIRKHTLTACKARYTRLLCPELPRRSWLLISTVWHVS